MYTRIIAVLTNKEEALVCLGNSPYECLHYLRVERPDQWVEDGLRDYGRWPRIKSLHEEIWMNGADANTGYWLRVKEVNPEPPRPVNRVSPPRYMPRTKNYPTPPRLRRMDLE